MDLGFRGFGFRVQRFGALDIGGLDLGFGILDCLGFKVLDLGSRLQGFWTDFGLRA